ncbi:MAG: trypsin-like peptidase domain-containing protein [Planctomycetota bacterium]|nr:trypsin-like peptidase domain-containing protein [Planctomycetota bacterium]
MQTPERRAAAAALALLSGLAADAKSQNLSLVTPPDTGRAGGPMAAAFEKAALGVVHVAVEVNGRNTFRIERPSSGAVLTADGLVLTHVSLVREAQGADDKRVLIQLADVQKTRYPARIVALDDDRTGLALLQAELPAGVELTPLAAGTAPAPGDPVAVLGFHDGEDQVAFAGVASPAAADLEVRDGERTLRFAAGDVLLTDAAIQARSHGAALIDRNGAFVGLCSADGVAPEISEPTLEDLKRPSFGFVIPLATARNAFGDAIPEAGSRSTQSAESRAVAKIADAIVSIEAGRTSRPETNDPFGQARRRGAGSGVVIDPSGLVLTNRHVVDVDGAPIRVRLADGRSLDARILSEDGRTNTALLRVELPAGATIPAAEIGAVPDTGSPVLTVGRPTGSSLSVGAGVLSAKRGGTLQVDAPVGNQNAGGAVVQIDGALIGLVDGGKIDRVDMAFAMRGDQAKLDTGLNNVPAIDSVLSPHMPHTADARGRTATPAPDGGPLAELVRATADSLLNIYIEAVAAPADDEDNPFAAPEARSVVESLGSGVVLDDSGLALTNWHVVDSATEPDGSMVRDRIVRAALRDGRKFRADVLSISREEDLALIQLRLEPGDRVRAIEFARSDELRIGDRAVAVGNPHGRANTLTAGVVTAKNQAIRVRGRWAKLPHLLETDAAINGGNSGGALLDAAGRLIGINSAGGSLHNVTGYAISVDHVRERLHSVLLSPEKLRSPYLGLTVADRDGAVIVHSVDPLGPAARAGVERGDRIVSLDGGEVTWSVGFQLAVREADDDAPVALGIERGGQKSQLDVDALSATQWSVFRQIDAEVDALSFREDADRVRESAIAFYRAFTGDPNAAPSMIPGSLVRVTRLHPKLTDGEEDNRVDLRVGDLLLGVQLDERQASGSAGQLIRFATVEDVKDCFNAYSTYEGARFRAWIERGGEVQQIDLPARRIML